MRRTRIVATIGPASDSDETLRAVLEAGANVCRLNYSHGVPEDKTEIYRKIRALESEIGRPTCILADLPGPKLRLGKFDGVVLLNRGDEVTLHCGLGEMAADCNNLPVDYSGLSAELSEGDPVLIADGLVRLIVLQSPGEANGQVLCTVEDGGPVSARKGVNVPGTLVDLPAIGERDEEALAHALKAGADYVAVSYVRTAGDLLPAKKAIAQAEMHVPLVAKIEHPAALDNLEEILDVADAVMVARGDLGVEIPMERVPIAQQRIIDAATARGMIVIVATQMLESMTLNPRPTRAEVSDVSTAIRCGATGVMLSGETASGEYPVAAVEAMDRIARETEKELDSYDIRPSALARFKSTRAVAHAAVELAKMAHADRIIVATEHGNAPRLVAGYRPDIPVTAVSDRIRAIRRMCLVPGVDGIVIDEHPRGSITMQAAIKGLVGDGRVQPGQLIVAISGSPLAMRGKTSTTRLYRIEDDYTISGTE